MRADARTTFPMAGHPDPTAIPIRPESIDPDMCGTGSNSDNHFMPGPRRFGTDDYFSGGRRRYGFLNDDASCVTARCDERTDTD
jgi:hypothetical protein